MASIKEGCATRSLYASSGPKAEGVPTNNLFECILYTNHRVKLYSVVMNYQPITTDKLLSGDPALSYDDNFEIMLAVQEYSSMKDTERF